MLAPDAPTFSPSRFFRLAASPEALDRLGSTAEVWRIAPDEALVPAADPHPPEVEDPHAIVVVDAGWHTTTMPVAAALTVLRHATDWPLPDPPSDGHPTLLQGAAHHVPITVRLSRDGATIAVPSALLAELLDRWPIGGAS